MKEILQTKFSTEYLKNIEILLARCSNREQVEFALYCASDTEPREPTKIYKARLECLELVKAWLVDPSSVTTEQLRIAANAAKVASFSAAAAATTVAAAAYAARAAASAAASTASAAASITATATYAVHAAHAASDNHSAKLKQFYTWLFDKLTKGMNKDVLEVLYG